MSRNVKETLKRRPTVGDSKAAELDNLTKRLKRELEASPLDIQELRVRTKPQGVRGSPPRLGLGKDRPPLARAGPGLLESIEVRDLDSPLAT